MIDKHYTVAQIAERLSRSPEWVRRAVERGLLKGFKLRNPDARGVTQQTRILIPESSVLELLGEKPRIARKSNQARARRALISLGLDPDRCGTGEGP